jgi:hypothetical protein
MYCLSLFIHEKNLTFFLLSLKYGKYRSENLHTYRKQHCLRPGFFFFKKFEMSRFEILKVQNLAYMEPDLQKAALLKFFLTNENSKSVAMFLKITIERTVCNS